MKKYLIIKTFTSLILLSNYLIAQDSLYLIGTITGESYDKRITNVSRVGDVNGDGYEDFMVSSRTGKTRSDQGIVQLYLGSATLDLIPNMTFHYPGNDSLNNGIDAFEIGDINNDGYDDFAISGIFGDYSGYPKGKVFLYYGGETIDTIPFAEFYEPWIQDYFGSVVEKVGDLNKDGFDDFTISSTYNWSNGLGYVYLFWGGDTISFDRSLTFTSDSLGDFFGESVANIGDINDDGFEDIAIGAPNILSSNDAGKVYIYYGGITIDTIPKHILGGGDIFRIDDINGDDKIEFIIYTGQVNIYFSLDSVMTFRSYVSSLCSGDVNLDGYDDFIIGYNNYRNSDSIMVGGTFVYFGGVTTDTVYTIKLEGENKWGEFSKIMSVADMNGDGYDELFVLAPGWPDYENPLGKIYIYSYINLTNVKDKKGNLLNNFELNQNYPNPFNPITTISWQSPVFSHTTIKVFDILGKEVATLVNEERPAGEYEVEFDATKYKLSSGIYFCELKLKGGNSSRIKMVLIK